MNLHNIGNSTQTIRYWITGVRERLVIRDLTNQHIINIMHRFGYTDALWIGLARDRINQLIAVRAEGRRRGLL